MEEFRLPHDHAEHHPAQLHAELSQTRRFAAVAEVFKQLDDPTRVKIFWLLCHHEECVINIACLLDMSSPAVSHHLRSLQDAGLITGRRDGKEVYYKASDTEECALLHQIVEQVMVISCPQKSVDYTATTEQIIPRVHDYLVEHLSERITVQELSKRFLMNPTTLKQAFKARYGTSLAAHIKKHRLEQAAQLLLKTHQSVGQIAASVGYESQSRFTAAFQEAYGVLPTTFRKNRAQSGMQD